MGPWIAYPVTGREGRLPCSGLVVTEGNLRGTG